MKCEILVPLVDTPESQARIPPNPTDFLSYTHFVTLLPSMWFSPTRWFSHSVMTNWTRESICCSLKQSFSLEGFPGLAKGAGSGLVQWDVDASLRQKNVNQRQKSELRLHTWPGSWRELCVLWLWCILPVYGPAHPSWTQETPSHTVSQTERFSSSSVKLLFPWG